MFRARIKQAVYGILVIVLPRFISFTEEMNSQTVKGYRINRGGGECMGTLI